MLSLNKHFKSVALILLLVSGTMAIPGCVDSSEGDSCDRNSPITIINPQTGKNMQIKRSELALSYAKQFVDQNRVTFSKAQEDMLIKKWCDYSNVIDKTANETETLEVLKDMNKDFKTTVDQLTQDLGKSQKSLNKPRLNI